jgi:hypothetical protein
LALLLVEHTEPCLFHTSVLLVKLHMQDGCPPPWDNGVILPTNCKVEARRGRFQEEGCWQERGGARG